MTLVPATAVLMVAVMAVTVAARFKKMADDREGHMPLLPLLPSLPPARPALDVVLETPDLKRMIDTLVARGSVPELCSY